MTMTGDLNTLQTIVDVVFAADGARLILSADLDIVRDEDAADILTDIIFRNPDRARAENEIAEVAEDLSWRVTMNPAGQTHSVHVRRA